MGRCALPCEGIRIDWGSPPRLARASVMLALTSVLRCPFLMFVISLASVTAFAQSTSKRPAPTEVNTTAKRSAPSASVGRTRPGESVRVAQRSGAGAEEPETREPAPLPARDPSRKVEQVASLTVDEVKAKQSTALRRSMTVVVPKLVTERQNVTRTIMTPVTSQELRPVWSPGQGRWLAYQPTGHTVWSPRTEVVPMDVPVWRYVAETRYVEEPIVRQNFYAPIQSAPVDAWAWKQPYGAGTQPIIPPYQPPSRPVLSFLQNRPVVGRLFGGGRPVFPPAPAPLGPVSANYQPVSYFSPGASSGVVAPPVGGTGIPAFTAPLLPTSSSAGNFGGMRSFQ